MLDYCECGSLFINNGCTNKKCKNNKKSLVDLATYDQINFINSLKKQVGDESEIDIDILTKVEASRFIEKLLEIKETGA